MVLDTPQYDRYVKCAELVPKYVGGVQHYSCDILLASDSSGRERAAKLGEEY